MNAMVSGGLPVVSAKHLDEHRLRRLTARQQAILDWIRAYIAQHRTPPTLREIGVAHGIRSTNGVNDHCRALERKGFIRRRDGLSRSIVVVGDPVIPPTPAVAIDEWRVENRALRQMLSRVLDASKRCPQFTAEMAVLLGDIRAVLKSGAA